MTQTAEPTAPTVAVSLEAIATATPAEINTALAELIDQIDALALSRAAALRALADAADDPDALAEAAARLAQVEIRLRALDERAAQLRDERPDAERRAVAAERDSARDEAVAYQAQADAMKPRVEELEEAIREAKQEQQRLYWLAADRADVMRQLSAKLRESPV